MQGLLRAATSLSALAATPLALQLQADQADPSTGARMWNLAGEAFDLNTPGDHLLLRLPKSKADPALLDVRGNFTYSDKETCALQLMTVTFRGEWFEGKTVKVSAMSGFAVKVSAPSPAYAGPWRSIEKFTLQREGQEALPGNIDVRKRVENSTIDFRFGAEDAKVHPFISIVQNQLHKALDMFLFDVHQVDAQEFGGLLGTEARNKTVEIPSAECAAQEGNLRINAQQQSSQLKASWSKA